MSCRRQKIVLPGTLLGLFPGVMCDPYVTMPQTPKASALRPFLLRYDGWWLDYEKELPYPMPPPGVSFEDHYEQFKFNAELRGTPDDELIQVPPQDINPYALGHLINHPPPDFLANVKLIDFDLPYNFFPSTHSRYIPYIKFREGLPNSQKHKSVTRDESVFRAVALVATETISHGEELYLNYLNDQRVCPSALSNAPDWLISPPDDNPYL